MMTLRNTLTLCALALPLAVAAQDHSVPGSVPSQHEQHAAQPGAAAGDDSTTGMHEHMREMREQMARIRETQDAGERERLMREHMQTMQQHMQLMGSRSPANGTMRSLENRLASIEQLLQQILEHQRVEEEQNALSRRDRNARR